jgi:thioredoxin-like negative regulator of GroEL
MTLRPKRLQALHDDVRGALKPLELAPGQPAHDGWLAPFAMTEACGQEAALLFRAASALGVGSEHRTPGPVDPWWVRSDGGPGLRVAPMRGGDHHELRVDEVALERHAELCCDAPKCEREQQVGEIWLKLEGSSGGPDALLVGERLGDEQEISAFGALGEALAERLGVPFAGDAGPPSAVEGEPLDAARLSRWSLRREGDHFVLRDHAQQGPREGVAREMAILAAMILAFAASWYGTYDAYLAQSWTTVAIFGATALVMTFFVVTMIQIVRHSMAYQARSEALLWLARDCLVVAPWHDRDGAIDVGTAGRYGAGIHLGELDEIHLVEEGGGWSVRCETAHGPIELGVLDDRELADRWRHALVTLVSAVAHGEPEAPKGKGGRAPAAAAMVFLGTLLLLTSCAEPHPVAPSPPGPSTVSPPPSAAVAGPASASAPPSVSGSEAAAPAGPEADLIEDDVPRAMAEAKASGKAVFVEVWAPWCHTCLSMKNFVLPDAALRPLRDEIVFAAIDSDRPENAAFMDRYTVNVWPTLFVLDPKEGEVVSLWQGAASVEELRGFLQDAIDAIDAKHDPNGPLAALIAAKGAHAKGQWAQAARHYQRALERGGKGWERRSETLAGLVFAEYRQAHWERCVQLGADHAAEIEGAAVPADFSWVVLDCADEVKAPALRDDARRAVLARLKRHTTNPPAAASVDDRSDALNIYASALAKAGDRDGAKAARTQQIALLEKAAAAAPSPKEAATFDYARMGAYLALGRGEEAVALLRRRREQLPDSYEPPARLAQALMALGRPRDAREPLSDAVDKSYGPRKLRYLGMLAELEGKLHNRAGQIAALQDLLEEHGSLSDSQQREGRLAKQAREARRKLRALGAAPR